jgi:DNA-binding FadR family transcriptional regulator
MASMTVSAPHDLTQALLRPVRGHHAFEACVEQLATAIRLGVYPRGSTLPSERALATRLRVSRATLREAMAALRQAGLVETTRGRGGGTVVTLKPRTPSARASSARAAARVPADARRDWLDVLEFRRVVEPGAAYLAARADLGEAGRAQLQQAHDEVAAAAKPATHRQADSRFHLTVAAVTGSPRVVEAVTAVQSSLHEMLLAIPVLEANIAHSDRQHAAILRAILRRDALRARTVMENHCDDTAALLRGLLA